LETLKIRHDKEIYELRELIQNQNQVKYTFSKELMDIRSMEKKFRQLKDYEKAEEWRREGEVMEKQER
jgi:hypothetical protein